MWRKSEKQLKAKYNEVKDCVGTFLTQERTALVQDKKKLDEFKKRYMHC